MLTIQYAPISDLASLRKALQDAIRLEHSTIPPYLCALMTLSGRSDSVRYARKLIQDIVAEEMLHMSLACNILNAIGGAPVLDRAPMSYPGPLPMSIAGGLRVHLKRYSHALVRDVFMEIEEPEKPLEIPIRTLRFEAAATGPRTIGEFYRDIRQEIVRQTDLIFTGDPARQVTTGLFAPGEEIVVNDVATALHAIETIVEQGEGTPQSPFDLQEDVAHYYRFQELEKGMKLDDDAASPLKISFDPNQPITIDDTADVIQMVDDPQLITIDAEADWRAAQLADECDTIYSKMLNALHAGFNGDPDKVGDAIGTMFEFKTTAGELLQQQLTTGQHAGLYAGPRFKYVVT